MNIFTTLTIFAALSMPLKSSAQQAERIWQEDYKRIEQQIVQPKFKDKEYYITQYGASTKASAQVNQKAINRAIAACAKAGGGKVIVPSGTWQTGAIHLKSNVNLEIQREAKLLFVYNLKLYPLVRTRWEGMDCINYSPMIYAYGEKNVAITGEGTIDGGATRNDWWRMCGAKKFGWTEGIISQRIGRPQLQQWNDANTPVDKRILGDGYGMRVQLINLNHCDNVLIEGVTMLRSPFWVIHPTFCKSLTVRGVKIWNEGPNGDGCDPESCDGVLIENCTFHTGDDCIAIKSGRNGDGRRANTPSQNIIVRHCNMEDGHGGVVIGSEISGGCRNVFVEDCTMDSPNLERVIRIKTNPCRGGITDGIYVRNIKVGRCREAVLKINLDYEAKEQSQRNFPPTVRNVYLNNVNCESSQYGIIIIGLQNESNIYNIHISNCRWNGVKKGGNSFKGQYHDVYINNVFINGSLLLQHKPYKNYSQWMAASEMRRTPHSYLLDFSKKPKWSYVMGIELESLLDVYLRYGDKRIFDYCKEYADTMISPNGEIKSYVLGKYNIDQIRTGRFIYRINQQLKQDKNYKAVRTLYKQLAHQPRTTDGSWWHKQIYPSQVWLDGLYMALPFYVTATKYVTHNPQRYYDDATNQLLKAYELTFDTATGLCRHGYDETKSIFWADPITGQSRHSWGRAEGWLAMAIIEMLDVLPENYNRRPEIIELFNKVMTAVVKYQDRDSGCWRLVLDVTDQNDRNYLEATCTAMFTYALLKGHRLGYLHDDMFRKAGERAYKGMLDNMIKVNADSTISLTSCVEVGGLGPANNLRRNGSFEYYLSEKVRDNDAKGIAPFIWASLEMERGNINREAIVIRNNPKNTSIDKLSSFSVGNGHFATTVDITGMQSLTDVYKNGIPLCTQSDWGWHSFPNTNGVRPEDSWRKITQNGQTGYYSCEYSDTYLRVNPHRLNLGCVGLSVDSTSISDINQQLNQWNGIISSNYKINNVPVCVKTACHPQRDMVAYTLKSKLLKTGDLQIFFRYPYPTGKHSDDASLWNVNDKHQSVIISKGKRQAILKLTLDSTIYYCSINWTDNATFQQQAPHCFTLTPHSDSILLTVEYSPNIEKASSKNCDVFALSANSWRKFWQECGFVDFSHVADPKARELERRTILSQYLTAIQCREQMPPQETGLTYNSWFGRPHLEMAWWHLLHFSLWNRPEVVAASLDWYNDIAMPKAKAIAERQGYKGIRWMKMTDPEAGEAPSNTGSFLIWQQPHYIYLAEEMYRHNPTMETLKKYAEGVEQTARFMADFMTEDSLKGATAMQETMNWKISFNHPFELAYWQYGLKTANLWRKRLCKECSAEYDHIINNIAHLCWQDSLYIAGMPINNADSIYKLKSRSDHPAVLGACGLLPSSDLYEQERMRQTLHWIINNWNWATTWGWDYGMVAMAAARLGEPALAIDALLMPVQKNTYLNNGHNYQDNRLRIYLPGNGAFLTAIAMMCTGWDNSTTPTPGFPKDWDVRFENLSQMQ